VRRALVLVAALAACAIPAYALAGGHAARAAPMLLGVTDDALFEGNLDQAIADSTDLHPQVVRYDLNWSKVAPTRPANGRDPDDPAYQWAPVDAIVSRLTVINVPVVLTIEVTPGWAGGGALGRHAPITMSRLEEFANAAATRYSGTHVDPVSGVVLPLVSRWEIWSEPNFVGHLTPQYSCSCKRGVPVSPNTYVRMLGAAYKGIHDAGTVANVTETVAAGATKAGGLNTKEEIAPLRFVRLLAAKKARFDVYSHHPYRVAAGGAKRGPDDVDFTNLPALTKQLDKSFPGKRYHVWITEYGRESSPDTFYGVSVAKQAQTLRQNVAKVRANPRIDMLIWYHIDDEAGQTRSAGIVTGFQSGLAYANGVRKPSWNVFRALAR
jgi:hypothetical protein